MALKKSQIYRSLWQSCDELRGGMDASQYKDYILTLLFMKYVSDKYGSNDEVLIVPKGGSFADMLKYKGHKEIGDKINIIIGEFAELNDLKDVLRLADFNDKTKLGDGQDMQDRLTKLLGIFESLDFRRNRRDGDDLLGDAYEYLMRHFATESGKSKGQFYTPAEVSQVIARIIGIEHARSMHEPTLYDPTCGSGSLLIHTADYADAKNLAIYGQEMDNATWSIARMNMILHGFAGAVLERGNTLSNPKIRKHGGLQRFDFAVANPPFSAKSWTTGFDPEHDEFNRFDGYSVPPPKNGDYAFLLHVVKSLNSTGKGAIILPHGVLFRGNKEAEIRRALIKRGVIKGIIGLPSNLFYGTGIPACIIVLDKANAKDRQGIFMLDASKGFIKDGNKNRLRAQDMHKIVDVFNKQIDVPRYARMVSISEIAHPNNDYNLNLPRYIDTSEPEDLHDLDAHLNGGIPNRDLDALADYWQVMPNLRVELFQPADRAGYSMPKVEPHKLRTTILNHPEFQEYRGRVQATFDAWRATHEQTLKDLHTRVNPKQIIHELGEDLLNRFKPLPLLDPYAVYQRLMDYWAEVMSDDVTMVVDHGWSDAIKPRKIADDKQHNLKETPDLVIGKLKLKMDVLPPILIVEAYFRQQKQELEQLQAQFETATQAVEAFIEEHPGDEGLLLEAYNEKGKITKASVKSRLKSLNTDHNQRSMDDGNADEIEVLQMCLDLFEAEAEAGNAFKQAKTRLDEEIKKTYDQLDGDEAEIKELVVDNKWLATIQAAIVDHYIAAELATLISEIERLTTTLAGRVKELEQRYAHTLAELEQRVRDGRAKVNQHLRRMGLRVS